MRLRKSKATGWSVKERQNGNFERIIIMRKQLLGTQFSIGTVLVEC